MTTALQGASVRTWAAAPSARETVFIASLLLQLVLVAFVFHTLDMQHSAFRRVFDVAVLAFAVNHLLPQRHRKRFFVLLCVACLWIVMGNSPTTFFDPVQATVRTVGVLAAGAVLVGVTLLPIPFWSRVAILVAIGGVYGAFRANIISVPDLLVVWPILASFVMFRLIVFLYETSTGRTRPSVSSMASYFLLFPNACSTLFPVVDYKTFNQSYSAGDALDIYRRGVQRVIRGALQLVFYRLIHELVSLPPEQVSSGTEVFQFVLVSTLVYTQVSGYFHVVTGLLMLFGFDLPETNRRYFLASSFTDYWRRINIYWKDFILKVFYNPAFFRLKRFGMTKALVLATAWAFFVTWALHLYQTWWIKGQAPVTLPDALFWGTLGALVVLNSLWEMKRGRRRTLQGRGEMGARAAAGVMLRTAATFACMSVLWSLWSSPTLAVWLGIWKHADGMTVLWAAAALLAIMVATLLLEIRPAAIVSLFPGTPQTTNGGWYLAAGAVPLVLVALASSTAVQRTVATDRTQPYLDALATGDSMSRELTGNRGYYEALASADVANLELWETLTGDEVAGFERYQGAHPVQRVMDFRFEAPLPNVETAAYDTFFRTNSAGMRDREYALQPADDTLRIAVLGSSHVMGWGVDADAVFTELLERRLNEEPPSGARYSRFEVLNFGFVSWSPLGQVDLLRKVVSRYRPDLVLFVSHLEDVSWVCRDLSRAVHDGVPVTEATLQAAAREARITSRTNMWIARARLSPHCDALTRWAYSELVGMSKTINARAVAVVLPLPLDMPVNPAPFVRQAELLGSGGFEVWNLSGLYSDLQKADIMRKERWWGGQQGHTNDLGHRRMADRLYAELSRGPWQ